MARNDPAPRLGGTRRATIAAGLFCLLVAVIFPTRTAIAAGIEPQAAAESERGRKIYNFRCYFCHGYSGDANTVAATLLKPKPRNFQTATIIDLPRARVVAAVTHGVAGSAMTSFESVLSPVEIAAVARFVETEFLLNRATNTRYHTPENGWPDHTRYRSAFAFVQDEIPLSRPLDRLTAEQRAGRMLFVTHCVTCHDRGGGNDDQGTRATWHKQPR